MGKGQHSSSDIERKRKCQGGKTSNNTNQKLLLEKRKNITRLLSISSVVAMVTTVTFCSSIANPISIVLKLLLPLRNPVLRIF